MIARGLHLSIAALIALAAAQAGAQESDLVQDGYEWARDLVEEHVPPEWADQLDLPETLNWEAIGPHIEELLGSVSWQDLAEYLPVARRCLTWLRQTDWGEPYAIWLDAKLDYFLMAERVVRPVPAPPPQTPPQPRPAARKAVDAKAAKAMTNMGTWKSALSRRGRPAAAELLLPELKDAFTAEGVPSELVWMAEVESSFNPKARSPAGAAGLFQIMPATARHLDLSTTPVDERLAPAKSARAAARYLKSLHKRFGSWPLALAAYNGGEGRVARVLKEQKATTFDDIAESLPLETRMYVPKVMATVALREGIDPAALPPPA